MEIIGTLRVPLAAARLVPSPPMTISTSAPMRSISEAKKMVSAWVSVRSMS